jgi:hypothetical protein
MAPDLHQGFTTQGQPWRLGSSVSHLLGNSRTHGGRRLPPGASPSCLRLSDDWMDWSPLLGCPRGCIYALGCHTWFPKRNQVHLICAPGSVHTHTIDKMSEISLTVFKRISEFNHLLHSCGRLEGLKQWKTIATRRVSVFRSHRHLTGGPQASELIVVVEN